MTDKATPIVINLGKKSKKKLKALKRGEGALTSEVQQALTQVRENLGAELGQRELLPVVVLYEKKTKRRGRLPIPMIF